MPSLKTTFAALLALGAIAPAVAQVGKPVGCFGSAGGNKNVGPNTYQSVSACRKQCLDLNQAVWGVTKGSTCYCGDTVPSEDDEVAADRCDVPCQGYPQEICGGNLAWTFGYTGVVPSETDEAASSTTRGPSSTIADGSPVQTTVINGEVTVTAKAGTDGQENGGGGGSGSSTAGIAAGAVVGVVAVIALGVGGFLYVRRNRRRQAEEEYRAAVAAKEFTASIRKPTSDSRLDPVMLQQRRLSDGSIADSEDYSRRILKVTNPDA